MYTRSLFQTPDMTDQHDILNEVAALLDAGKIKSTATETLGKINAVNLKKAHEFWRAIQRLESWYWSGSDPHTKGALRIITAPHIADGAVCDVRERLLEVRIDWEAFGQSLNFCLNLGFDFGVAVRAICRQTVNHFDNPICDLAELCFAKSACCARW